MDFQRSSLSSPEEQYSHDKVGGHCVLLYRARSKIFCVLDISKKLCPFNYSNVFLLAFFLHFRYSIQSSLLLVFSAHLLVFGVWFLSDDDTTLLLYFSIFFSNLLFIYFFLEILKLLHFYTIEFQYETLSNLEETCIISSDYLKSIR